MILPLLAAATAAASPVVVSPLRTEQLAAECRGKDADTAASFCTGFILGVFDTLSASHLICPSADRASVAAVVRSARKYLRGHEEQWSSAPAFVVRDALRGAFPCRAAKRDADQRATARPAAGSNRKRRPSTVSTTRPRSVPLRHGAGQRRDAE